MRFPRPCRFVARRFVFTREFAVGEPLAEYVAHGEFKTLAVIHVPAVVVAEGLFVKVAEKMKRFHANVGSRNATLEKRPEIFKAVSVDAAIYVLSGVVNDLMCVIACQPFIREQCIGIESRASFYMLADFTLQCLLLAIRYDCGKFDSR